MKSGKHNVLSCLLVLSLLVIAGCGKKPEQGTSTQGAAPKETAPATTPSTAPAATPAATTPAATTPAAAMPASVDIEKPVAEIQAQAQTMSVDSLRATALKYKEAILAKQTQIEQLAAKVKDIPIAQALGEEAKTLKTDLTNLQTSLKALQDRFQVYYNTLKEKGGDLSGLTP